MSEPSVPTNPVGATLIVCTNLRSNPRQPSCAARGGRELYARLTAEVKARGLPVQVEASGCLGYCQDGPALRIAPGGRFFLRMDSEEMGAVFAELVAFLSSSQPSSG